MNKIKTFANGSFLSYGRGKIDDYCVYFHPIDHKKYAPTDKMYFGSLKKMAETYSVKKVYGDFCKVYNRVKKDIKQKDLDYVSKLAKTYGEDALKMDIIFSIFYLAMVSEQKKKNAILGKRIKRLGVHRMLIDNVPISYATTYMIGVPWRKLDKECRACGF